MHILVCIIVIIKIDSYCLGEEMKDDQMKALTPIQSEMGQEDGKTQDEDSASELPSNKDFKSLFDEQEKFYKTEISRKDDAISHLMIENEKTQQQIQDLKEKLGKGKSKAF